MATGDVAVLDHRTVMEAISPARAIECVADGFVRFARGEWTMPPKIYLQAPGGGDFRAMPALGDSTAILKWVTSFPENPQKGLPTVTGVVVASDALTGETLALVDARAVTALRTGASAAIATRALAPRAAARAGIVGCGLHGAWAARCLAELGYTEGVCFDVDSAHARSLAYELGWDVGSLGDARACDVVTTVTPGREPVVRARDVRPGMHFNALGADGSGKAEMEVRAVASCKVFVDEWEQASHGGEITGAVEAGLLTREAVTELGRVLVGDAPGRASDDDATLFDSTGLAIQDLAIVRELIRRLEAGELEVSSVSL